MNVLHIASALDRAIGGLITAFEGLAAAQQKAGLKVTLAATHLQGEDMAVVDALESVGVVVRTVGPCKTALRWHPDLPQVIDELVRQTDMVHIHGCWEEIHHVAAKLARRHSIPYVITPHGMLSSWALGKKSLKKKLYMLLRLRRHLGHATAIHYTTELERLSVAEHNRRAAAIIEPNGIALDVFEELPPAGSFRARHTATQDRKLVVFLGRIFPGKGLEYLVPAMAQVSDPNALLVIGGPDEQGYQAQVEQMIHEHELHDRVLFTGMLQGKALIETLVDADLFCLPSDHENFGLAIVEALAAKNPVIVSDQVAIHPEITQGQVGCVVPCSSNKVAEAISEWLADDELRAAAAQRARPFVWDRYGWSSIAQRWKTHYEEILVNGGVRD